MTLLEHLLTTHKERTIGPNIAQKKIIKISFMQVSTDYKHDILMDSITDN